MSHANSVRLVTEVQAKNSERFLYITFYATHCWEQKLQPPSNGLRWCLLHFCGEVSCTGVCTFLHLHHFISILFAIFFVCVVHFLGTRRSSDFCSAADSTPLSVYLGCPPHYPLYISNYTLILNLKHLQTDAWVWRSLRFSVTIFHFPCHEAAKMLGHKRNRPDFPVTAKET